MWISTLIQFLIIIAILWTIFIRTNTHNNNFSNWDKNNIIQIKQNIKPIKIKNLYNIILNVKNFKNYNINWIKFTLETTNSDNSYTIINDWIQKGNFFFTSISWEQNYSIYYDKVKSSTKWNINLAYNVWVSDVNKENWIYKIDIKETNITTVQDWNEKLINIQSKYPFNIILYNYKYKLKKDARWQIIYNSNQTTINNNFFINKVN